MGRKVGTTTGRRSLGATLEQAIGDLRGGDALAPVAVVVPNPLLGVWLSRTIFAATGHAGIDFVMAHELAWRVAMPRLLAEGRARTPENVDIALLLGAVPAAVADPDTPDYLRAAAETAGFGPAALRTLQELAGTRLAPEDLEKAADAPGSADPARLRLMARLWRGFAAGLARARLLTRPALFRAAVEALPDPAIGAVVVCGLDDPPPAAAGFLEALRRHHRFALVLDPAPAAVAPRHASRESALARGLGQPVPAGGDGDAKTSLQRLQQRLFAPVAAPSAKGQKAPLDPTVQVLSAAGASLEAVEIARLIQQAAAEGVRYQEMAVLLRHPEAYAVVFASAFQRAGIQAFFVEGVPRIDPAARSLSLLLDLVGADLDRARVMEFLTSTRVRWDAILGPGADVSPSRWDRLSAEAGIVSGLEAWRARLARARGSREAREFQDDRDLRLYDTLRRLVDRLAGDLAAMPENGTWAEFLDATLALLEAWIERPALTRERLERLLGPLTRYAPAPSREQFLSRVRQLLASQVYREGSLEEGRVLVGSIAAARGLRFRRVFVPGLVEGAFPSVVRPDPLLLDEERAALSPDLATTRDGLEADRLLFLDAVRAAEERLVLSYPRFDTASGRERVSSSFLLRALEAALGRRVSATDLARLASPGATALGRPHPEDPAAAIDRVERDLALVASGRRGAARHLASPEGFLVRSLAQERSSRQRTLTEWDGIVEADAEALAGLRLAGRHWSASAVQDFAACPYRHFLKRGLKLRAWEEPERAYQIDSNDFGSLYHEVAHRLFADLAEQKSLPLRKDGLGALVERIELLVDAALAAFAAEGGIINPALLDPVRVRLRSDIEEMLADDVEAADAADEFVPVAFEQEFADLTVPLARRESVTFDGKIDRIDATRKTRRVRVIDYKTGKYIWKQDEQWKGGTELQLAIYNLAARAAYPKHEVAEAVYYYATAAGDYKKKICAATPDAEETLRKVLVTLDGLAAEGVFPPVADNCRFCDYQSVCGPFREERAQRKSADPRLAAFKRLRDIQ